MQVPEVDFFFLEVFSSILIFRFSEKFHTNLSQEVFLKIKNFSFIIILILNVSHIGPLMWYNNFVSISAKMLVGSDFRLVIISFL